MPTNINITANGQVVTRVTFDVATHYLRYESEMTAAGIKRAIGDAIHILVVTPENQARARVAVEDLHAHGAAVDVFARDLMRVVIEVVGGGKSDGLPANVDVELGDWKVSEDDVPDRPELPESALN